MNQPEVLELFGASFTKRDLIWEAVGLVGQMLFFSRFLVQWLASERAKKSVIPTAFWYFSISGGLIVLVYAWFGKHSIPITLGQILGVFIYSRNLILIHREERRALA